MGSESSFSDFESIGGLQSARRGVSALMHVGSAASCSFFSLMYCEATKNNAVSNSDSRTVGGLFGFASDDQKVCVHVDAHWVGHVLQFHFLDVLHGISFTICEILILRFWEVFGCDFQKSGSSGGPKSGCIGASAFDATSGRPRPAASSL